MKPKMLERDDTVSLTHIADGYFPKYVYVVIPQKIEGADSCRGFWSYGKAQKYRRGLGAGHVIASVRLDPERHEFPVRLIQIT